MNRGPLSPEMLALAAERYRRLQLQDAFDPNNLSTKPTSAQEEIFTDFGTVKRQYVIAGNQCLAKGTLITTPAGPVAIEDLRPGDTVYDEHGKPIRVLKTFVNGPKEVYSLKSRSTEWAVATAEHVWLTETYDRKDQPIGLAQVTSLKLGEKSKVKRTFVKAPLGNVSVPTAYTLGVCLGDGCSKQPGRILQISSGTEPVILKVANELSTSYRRAHVLNYTWKLDVDVNTLPYYKEWCKDKYAHEKQINLTLLKTWDRASCLRLLAGLFDTDGSLCGNEKAKTVRWAIGMQAESVIKAVDYLLLALWQIKSNRATDSRKKYVNGPLHISYITSPHDIKRMMEELQPHLVSEQKYWKEEYNTYGQRSYVDRIKLSAIPAGVEETYDIHVDSSTNLYLLANGLVTHNSGKSQTCSRLTAWVLSETHPHWTRPKEWNQEPLLLVVCGRTGKQLEESIVPRICAYLPSGDYKVVRIGNISQRIEHVNGNRIVFQSLENPQIARERIQSYVAHFAWVDEMPAIVGIIDELIMRINSKNGYFLASFTPLVYNPDIKKMVEAAVLPLSKKYKLKMFDNPVYADPVRQEEILASMAHLPDSVRNCRLYGEWMEAESSVWHIDRHVMVETPPNYHPSWRHVEASDPAVSSKFGLSVWAEDPVTGIWYCIRDDYLEGIAAPDDIVAEVKRRTEGINIVRRICDPHESWYLGQAAKAGLSYLCPKKDGRKDDLIKNLQTALSSGRIKLAPWCTRVLDELERAHWSSSDTGRNKIVGGSKLHLCVTEDTYIWTDQGPRLITDIKVGDLVYTHKGRLRPVTRVWELTDFAPVNTLKCSFTAPLNITQNHPIFTGTVVRHCLDGSTGQLKLTDSTSWTPVGSLPSVLSAQKKRELPLCPTVLAVGSPLPSVDLKRAFIEGYYAAEGSKSARGRQVSFAGHQNEKNVFSVIKEVFGEEKVRWRDTEGQSRSIYVNSAELMRHYSKYKTFANKAFPEELMNVDRETAWMYLLGYLFGDGCFTSASDGIVASTISEKLAKQLHYLGHLVGHRPYLRLQKRAGRWKGLGLSGMIKSDSWSLTWNPSDSHSMIDKIRSIDWLSHIYEDKRVELTVKEGRKTSWSWSNEEYTAYRVTSNSLAALQPARTFTLSVEEDNSYLAEGIAVKNCDTAQYFVDLMPIRSSEHIHLPWHSELRQANEKRKSLVKEQAQLRVGKKKKWILR